MNRVANRHIKVWTRRWCGPTAHQTARLLATQRTRRMYPPASFPHQAMHREQKFALRVLAPAVLPLAPAVTPFAPSVLPLTPAAPPGHGARPHAAVHATATTCSPAAPSMALPDGVSAISCSTAPSALTPTEGGEGPIDQPLHLPTSVHPGSALSPSKPGGMPVEHYEEAEGLLRSNSSRDVGTQGEHTPGTSKVDPAQGLPGLRFNVQGYQRPELSSPGAMRPANSHSPRFGRGNSFSRALRQGALTLIDKVSQGAGHAQA